MDFNGSFDSMFLSPHQPQTAAPTSPCLPKNVNSKWGLGALAISALGVGGYFLYQHFKTRSNSEGSTSSNLPQQPVVPASSPPSLSSWISENNNNNNNNNDEDEILSLRQKLKENEEKLKKERQEKEEMEKTLNNMHWRIGQLLEERKEISDLNECPICYTDRVDMILSCGHLLCSSCAKTMAHESKNVKCPYCRRKVTFQQLQTCNY